MANSLYSILMSMANNPETLREATKKARPKIKKDYDKNVRRKMVQYYLDSYRPESYRRQNPSPLFDAYTTKTKLVDGGTMVEVLVTGTDIDLGDYYNSNSYYHQGGDEWESMTSIHSLTGRTYMTLKEELQEEYGQMHGTVQGSWILENFEQGIHPRTNGWPRKKWSRKMQWRPKKDNSTPLKMAEEYADKYFNLDTSYQYVLTELDKMWNKMF